MPVLSATTPPPPLPRAQEAFMKAEQARAARAERELAAMKDALFKA